MSCRICNGKTIELFHKDKTREYFRCRSCSFVFVPSKYHLPRDEEKARYDLHENDPEDGGYRSFLSKLARPMMEKLEPGARGLDFGCGPGPTLSRLFEEAGFACENYDPFYFPKSALLKAKYDFISCSEVIEHCADPRAEFERMLSLIKPGGILGIMTQFVRDRDAFKRWRYIDDDTHVSFFSKECMSWLAQTYNLRISFFDHCVTLFYT